MCVCAHITLIFLFCHYVGWQHIIVKLGYDNLLTCQFKLHYVQGKEYLQGIQDARGPRLRGPEGAGRGAEEGRRLPGRQAEEVGRGDAQQKGPFVFHS